MHTITLRNSAEWVGGPSIGNRMELLIDGVPLQGVLCVTITAEPNKLVEVNITMVGHIRVHDVLVENVLEEIKKL